MTQGKRSNHVTVSGKGEVPDPGLDQGLRLESVVRASGAWPSVNKRSGPSLVRQDESDGFLISRRRHSEIHIYFHQGGAL